MSDRRVSEQRVNIPSVNKVMNSDALQQHRDHLEHNVFKSFVFKKHIVSSTHSARRVWKDTF